MPTYSNTKLNGTISAKKGNLYAVLYLYVDGKRTPKWISLKLKDTKKNRQEAERRLVHLLEEYEQKAAAEAALTSQVQTVHDASVDFVTYLESWLHMRKSDTAVTTYKSYQSMVMGKIKRYFTEKPVSLQDLKPIHIQDFLQTFIDAGFTTNTALHYYAVLSCALEHAVNMELIERNPCKKVKRPSKGNFVGSFLTVDEVSAVLDVLEGNEIKVCVMLAVFCGLRVSEAVGLRWQDVDFEKSTIRICHHVVQLKSSTDSIVTEDALKSKTSFRTLTMTSTLKEYLYSLKERQELNRQWFGNAYSSDYLEYVCVDALGELIPPRRVSERFPKILEKHGMKRIRFHDLRHTCASLLLTQNVPMKAIQEWLGHSDMSTTANIYSHLSPDAHCATAAAMEAVFRENSTTA